MESPEQRQEVLTALRERKSSPLSAEAPALPLVANGHFPTSTQVAKRTKTRAAERNPVSEHTALSSFDQRVLILLRFPPAKTH